MTHQANVKHLVSKLNFKIGDKARRLSNPDGPAGRFRKLQKTVTALIKYERIELKYNRADEARGYVERLISEARRFGPTHKDTMEIADYWILEKQLVHKLFKVLVPRYEDYTQSVTKLYKAPRDYPGDYRARAVLELRGNIYPSLNMQNPNTYSMIHNVLLSEARKEYRLEKYKQVAENLAQ
ncbi:39S ribosomal protein L17, mitochondrial [Belonocnema kinseyi]|uniref:39S ribosomal protein L17, mitochondrial n=1 Tax=Belonocnema kinseyi TaxID=2817044 RepID=UPI00143DB91C|nr:39S ribosomal protein L17, mitochondrial [Belonocnema kinseyi]